MRLSELSLAELERALFDTNESIDAVIACAGIRPLDAPRALGKLAWRKTDLQLAIQYRLRHPALSFEPEAA